MIDHMTDRDLDHVVPDLPVHAVHDLYRTDPTQERHVLYVVQIVWLPSRQHDKIMQIEEGRSFHHSGRDECCCAASKQPIGSLPSGHS